jgi:hypothetical protein
LSGRVFMIPRRNRVSLSGKCFDVREALMEERLGEASEKRGSATISVSRSSVRRSIIVAGSHFPHTLHNPASMNADPILLPTRSMFMEAGSCKVLKD